MLRSYAGPEGKGPQQHSWDWIPAPQPFAPVLMHKHR